MFFSPASVGKPLNRGEGRFKCKSGERSYHSSWLLFVPHSRLRLAYSRVGWGMAFSLDTGEKNRLSALWSGQFLLGRYALQWLELSGASQCGVG